MLSLHATSVHGKEECRLGEFSPKTGLSTASADASPVEKVKMTTLPLWMVISGFNFPEQLDSSFEEPLGLPDHLSKGIVNDQELRNRITEYNKAGTSYDESVAVSRILSQVGTENPRDLHFHKIQKYVAEKYSVNLIR